MADTARLGCLQDRITVVRSAENVTLNAVRLVIDDVNARGGVGGRQIELVHREAAGAPGGPEENVIEAWKQLAAQDRVVGIVGPAVTHNVLAVHPVVERERVPAMHWAGTDAACGEWHFQFQAGYLPHEGPALVYLMSRQGLKRVAFFRGPGPLGAAYLRPFQAAAQAADIEIVANRILPPPRADVWGEVEQARRAGPDAVVGMGLLPAMVPLAAAMQELGWDVPRFGSAGFMISATNDEARRAMEGWIFTDLFDGGNPRTKRVLDLYEQRYGRRYENFSTTVDSDIATLMVAGLERAPEPTSDGLRQGLEAVRDMPASTGGTGTTMGFGPGDRTALKGPRLIVFRRVTADGVVPYPA